MSKLFVEGVKAKDLAYTNIRDIDNAICRTAKQLTENLWSRYRKHADPQFQTELQSDFHARFWEMYVTCSLEELGLDVQCPKPGPDVLITYKGQKICIEAVAPTGGAPGNPDRVPGYVMGTAQNLPDDQVILRLRSAIEEKYQNKYRAYRDRGIIASGDCYVVAINGCQINFARTDREPPRIVRSVFPIGDLQVVLDRECFEVLKTKHTHRPTIRKSKGADVSTAIFLQESYKGLSAVLYSNTDATNAPARVGLDYILVHNPLAENPLPHGVIRLGKEYVALGRGAEYELAVNDWREDVENSA